MATYYIAPSGSDTAGSGTLIAPWRTYGKFFNIPPAPGDTLYCRGGTYASTPTYTVNAVSGSAGSPITVAAYPGEVPSFVGTGSAWNHPLGISYGSSYIVIDGLQFSNFNVVESAPIWIGYWSPSTHHITIRRCKVTAYAGLTMNEHGIYVSGYTDSTTIEDCVILGEAGGSAGAGIHAYAGSSPGPTNLVIQRNVVVGWGIGGILIWHSGATGSATHNTIIGAADLFDLTYHSTLLIRDNVGNTGTEHNIYDPNNSAYTTADHNYWGETFNADYSLKPGSPAINGALDGSDAGAIPYDEAGSGVARSIIVVI